MLEAYLTDGSDLDISDDEYDSEGEKEYPRVETPNIDKGSEEVYESTLALILARNLKRSEQPSRCRNGVDYAFELCWRGQTLNKFTKPLKSASSPISPATKLCSCKHGSGRGNSS